MYMCVYICVCVYLREKRLRKHPKIFIVNMVLGWKHVFSLLLNILFCNYCLILVFRRNDATGKEKWNMVVIIIERSCWIYTVNMKTSITNNTTWYFWVLNCAGIIWSTLHKLNYIISQITKWGHYYYYYYYYSHCIDIAQKGLTTSQSSQLRSSGPEIWRLVWFRVCTLNFWF